MTRTIRSVTTSLALGLLLAGGVIHLVAADAVVRYEALPGSKVKIDGTSTLHDWTVEGRLIGGAIEFDPTFETDPTLKSAHHPPKLEATIPTRSLKSGKKAMDAVMHDAMKATNHPNIIYRLQSMTAKGAATPEGGIEFDTVGTLTVAGVTKTNTMVVKMDKLDGGKIKFTGTTPLKMTDFGIQPPAPSVALGLIKTGDEVKISFEWLTGRPAAKP
ncbi:MAG TPA: YceI family protein [Methylomirabilota bacterium]|nr:YceI family protein [Methylomirabilota bacterium]